MTHFLILLFIVTAFLGSYPSLQADAGLEAQKQTGQQTYMMVCLACHQPTGLGIPGMFPPLAGSDWITAKKPDRLIRVVLHGITGPIKINGQPFTTPAPLMPGQATLSDEQIANVLTYIRNSWNNQASAVKPEEVAAIREAEKGRATLWTEDELLKIPVE